MCIWYGNCWVQFRIFPITTLPNRNITPKSQAFKRLRPPSGQTLVIPCCRHPRVVVTCKKPKQIGPYSMLMEVKPYLVGKHSVLVKDGIANYFGIKLIYSDLEFRKNYNTWKFLIYAEWKSSKMFKN